MNLNRIKRLLNLKKKDELIAHADSIGLKNLSNENKNGIISAILNSGKNRKTNKFLNNTFWDHHKTAVILCGIIGTVITTISLILFILDGQRYEKLSAKVIAAYNSNDWVMLEKITNKFPNSYDFRDLRNFCIGVLQFYSMKGSVNPEYYLSKVSENSEFFTQSQKELLHVLSKNYENNHHALQIEFNKILDRMERLRIKDIVFLYLKIVINFGVMNVSELNERYINFKFDYNSENVIKGNLTVKKGVTFNMNYTEVFGGVEIVDFMFNYSLFLSAHNEGNQIKKQQQSDIIENILAKKSIVSQHDDDGEFNRHLEPDVISSARNFCTFSKYPVDINFFDVIDEYFKLRTQPPYISFSSTLEKPVGRECGCNNIKIIPSEFIPTKKN